MLFPYNVDVALKRLPIANWALIGATVLIGFPCWSDVETYYENADRGFLYLGREEDFAWHQLVGNLFGHADFFHLLGNMWMLFLYGNAVNAKLGHLAYILLYFAIGIVESLIWLWFGAGEVTLGASGAVMGIVGAFVVFYPRNNVSIFYWLFIVKMGTWTVSAYVVIAFYVVLDFVGLLGGGGVVNHLAHVAGAALGFGAAMAAVATFVETDPGEQSLLDIMRGRRAFSHADMYQLRDLAPARATRPSAPRPAPGASRPTPAGSRPATGTPPPRPAGRPPKDLPPIPLVDEEPPGAREQGQRR